MLAQNGPLIQAWVTAHPAAAAFCDQSGGGLRMDVGHFIVKRLRVNQTRAGFTLVCPPPTLNAHELCTMCHCTTREK